MILLYLHRYRSVRLWKQRKSENDASLSCWTEISCVYYATVLTSVRVQINRKHLVLHHGSTWHQTETTTKLLRQCFYMLPLKHSWTLENTASTCRTFRRRQSDVYIYRERDRGRASSSRSDETPFLFFFGWTLAIVALSHGFRRKKKTISQTQTVRRKRE